MLIIFNNIVYCCFSEVFSYKWTILIYSECNCHNHTMECVYDITVAVYGLSIDTTGQINGGGVCQQCQHNTKGNKTFFLFIYFLGLLFLKPSFFLIILIYISPC